MVTGELIVMNGQKRLRSCLTEERKEVNGNVNKKKNKGKCPCVAKLASLTILFDTHKAAAVSVLYVSIIMMIK